MTPLEHAKLALRITSDSYDEDINLLIEAGLKDLNIAGVDFSDIKDPLVLQAVITYVRCHFGTPPDYEQVKASYDEQKAQLSYATGYTDYGSIDEEGGGDSYADCW